MADVLDEDRIAVDVIDAPTYRAWCQECGWRAPIRIAREAAVFDGDQHRCTDMKSTEGRLESIRELHSPTRPPEGMQWLDGGNGQKCEGCQTGNPFLDPEWPCLTRRLADGTEVVDNSTP